MVSRGMRRYRRRTDRQARFIGDGDGPERLDAETLFGRRRPWRLEIGFGHGEFITQMAVAHPEEDFIGVEHDPLRVTKTAHKCDKLGIDNVRLFSADAQRFVRDRLPPASLSRAYILFSDPWPKARHRRRRLINRAFLLDLAWALAPGARLEVASDTHNYALGVLSHLSTLPGLWINEFPPVGYRFDIPTRFPTLFERYKKAEGCSICYLHVRRSDAVAPPRVPLRQVDGALGTEPSSDDRASTS